MSVLTDADRALLCEARRAVLVTVRPDGLPRPMPVCHALLGDVVYSPLDEKPKRTTDPRSLARVRDLLREPRAALLVDRWSEDWSTLAWLRLDVLGSLLEPGGEEHAHALAALRARYGQYRLQRLEVRPILRLEPVGRVGWSGVDPAA